MAKRAPDPAEHVQGNGVANHADWGVAPNGSASATPAHWDAVPTNGMTSAGPSTYDAASARRAEDLDNPLQQRLYRLIEEAPGLNINELADEVGMSRSSSRYHLGRLMKEGLVVTHRQGHNRFHFAASMPVMRRKAVFLLRLGTIRSLVDTTIEDGNLRTADFAEMLGISPRSVRRNLKLLEREGLARCHPVKNDRGAYHFSFHPDLRVAWVLYCKDAERSTMRPLGKAPAIIVGLELLFGSFAFNWSS